MTYTEALEARKRERAAQAQPAIEKKAFTHDENGTSNAKGGQITDAVTPNTMVGAGAGALAGLGTAAGVYGLAGLFPYLRQRRLLKALIATAAGGVVGTAAGIATTKGMNDGSIPKALGDLTAKARRAYGKAAPVVANAASTAKDAVGKGIDYAKDALKGSNQTEEKKEKG